MSAVEGGNKVVVGLGGGTGGSSDGQGAQEGRTGSLLLNEIRLGEKSAVVALPIAPPKEALMVMRMWLTETRQAPVPASMRTALRGMLSRMDDRPWFFPGVYRREEILEEDDDNIRLGCVKCALGGKRMEMTPVVVECRCSGGWGGVQGVPNLSVAGAVRP